MDGHSSSSPSKLLALCPIRLLDVLLATVLLGVSLAGIQSGISINKAGSISSQVIISINGKAHSTLALISPSPQTIEAGALRVLVEQGRVRVTEASCSQQVCVNHGWISQPGESIICLPNRTLIEIRGNTDTDNVDAVSR